MKLVVGLGNPGVEYERTRHNAGFDWINALTDRLRLAWTHDKKLGAFIARGNFLGEEIIFLKPMQFMNCSGVAIAHVARFYKIDSTNILIACDELDVAVGLARLRLGGSTTHNGLRDTTAKLGTTNYWRLKIGIGHPGHKSLVVAWTLGRPSPQDAQNISSCIHRTLEAFGPWVKGETERAVQIVHTAAL